jgi:murein DD-endopeptidase MepM/ murein hydrolase activator NlpD
MDNKLTNDQAGEPSAGFAARLLRAGLNVTAVLCLAALALVAWLRLPSLLNKNNQPVSAQASLITQAPSQSDEVTAQPAGELQLNNLNVASNLHADDLGGITRKTLLYTLIPNRPRVDVITYTVQTGDSLFSIADQFGLQPETILWGNFEILEDNPHLLSTGQVLNILPVDGTYYKWNTGDSLARVAEFFGADPEAILSYPGNYIDLTTTDAFTTSTGIQAGSWVIVPSGRRPLKDWGPPAISRSNPASARYYGDGYCGSVYEGAIGTGTFIWPTTDRSISGYNYSGIHPAIDIGGSLGNPIYASDNGVVVFSGWSNYGYGYMVVIDHGNGWQTAYAHLSAVAVGCGQSVFQGGYIGALGSTGNSSGPHLHFELVYNGAKPNPLDYLQ